MPNVLKEQFSGKNLKKMFFALCGVAVYCAGTNLFMVPQHLYNGGLVGLAQAIRDILVRVGMLPESVEIAGVLSFILNIPLLILAFKSINKPYFFKTLICIAVQSLLLQLIPIPGQVHPIWHINLPSFVTDRWTACLIGGILSGFGAGVTLRYGGSGGGCDILGMYFVKTKPSFSVGKVTILFSAIIYIACLCLNGLDGIDIVIYSFIYSVIYSLAVDKAHLQNINTEARILSKASPEVMDAMEAEIMSELVRGVTVIHGEGAYTKEETTMLLVVVSKYEMPYLIKIARKYDPNAFIISKDDVVVSGNFKRHLHV